MKVRTYGLKIENKYKLISIDDIFDFFSQEGILECNEKDVCKRVICFNREGEDLKGCIITFKDQKTNCLGSFKNGEFTITTEDLKDNQLINHNFFLMRKSSEKNMIKIVYMYHHNSCTYSKIFKIIESSIKKWVIDKRDNEVDLLKQKHESFQNKKELNKEIKSIQNKYLGELTLSLIVENHKIEKLLNELEQIKRVSISFSTSFLDGSSKVMPITELSDETRLEFGINKKLNKMTIIESIKKIVNFSNRGKITGVSPTGDERVIDFFETPIFFDEYDLDELNMLVHDLNRNNYMKNKIYKKIDKVFQNNRLILK